MARTYYQYDPQNPPLNRILLCTTDGVGLTTLYVPPLGDELPWTESFSSWQDAIQIALQYGSGINQPFILETRDQVDWWLSGLQPDNGA